MRPGIYIFTEDELGLAVAKKIANELGFEIVHSNELKGNGRLKKNIRNYNEIANHYPVLVLTDLDSKECAPGLYKDWVSGLNVSENLHLRINVREIESWLFGDIENFAEFLGIRAGNMPVEPEEIADPKQELFNLVRKKSSKRRIKEGILPLNNSRLGPEYNSILIEFVRKKYNTKNAEKRCNSLARTIRCKSS